MTDTYNFIVSLLGNFMLAFILGCLAVWVWSLFVGFVTVLNLHYWQISLARKDRKFQWSWMKWRYLPKSIFTGIFEHAALTFQSTGRNKYSAYSRDHSHYGRWSGFGDWSITPNTASEEPTEQPEL